MEFDQNLTRPETGYQHVVQNPEFGSFDVHLQNVDAMVPQFTHYGFYRFDWNSDGYGRS
jgi:hypothetical protein